MQLNKEDIVAYRTDFLKRLSNTRKEEPFSLINFASFLGQGKKEIRQGLNILSTFFRDALVLKETQKNEMLINKDNFFYFKLCRAFVRLINPPEYSSGGTGRGFTGAECQQIIDIGNNGI